MGVLSGPSPRWRIRGLSATVVAALLLFGAPAGAEHAAAPDARDVVAGQSALAVSQPQPGRFTGEGFDACTAPSGATMQAWLASPYRAIGIYFGGNNRACQQPNLTASWVSDQVAAGWHLFPIYLGPQASCTVSSKRYKIDNTRAAAQGRAAAEDAVVQAAAIGLPRESVLIYDMEAYATNDAACRAGVLAFMSAWTARLHDHGYFSGFYSSMASGVKDQVDNYAKPGYVRPDYLDFARWDRVVTVTDPEIPAGYWMPKRRMKQYRGDHNETWGGVTINIDNDYLDMAPLPRTASGDYTGNGWSDVLARTSSTGNLYLYPGNGTVLDEGARRWMGGGWNAMSAIVRIGDLDRDGREDVVAHEAATGYLWFYPGTGTGVGTRKRIGTGWNNMREITAVGDFNRDGYPDLAAANKTDNKLYLYAGRAGAALGTRAVIGGSGWQTVDELAGVGDFDRDGYPDMIARLKSTNALYLYPGRGNGFAARRQVGTGWGGMRSLVGVGDFDRDGYPDLFTVQKSTGNAYLYPGRGTGFRARTVLSTGYGGRSPVA